MYDLFLKMVHLVESFGYFGIFIMTLIEGTFVPIPNEITIIPAGYLVAKGDLNLWGVLAVGILGNLAGSLISYGIAKKYGRMIVHKYGRYIMFSEAKLKKVEAFFKKHGPISVFLGRILPGIKHFIAFPAGLGRMNLKSFCAYTGTGGGLWITVLVSLGYFIGMNEDLINEYLDKINIWVLVLSGIIISVYFLLNKTRQNKNT